MNRLSIFEENFLKNFSPAQRKIIVDDHPVKQIIAGAGSGKTRTVAGIISWQVSFRNMAPGSILVLSFSRKAAGEIRDRLSESLRDSVDVSTFHSLAFRKIRQYHPHFQNQEIGIVSEQDKNSFYSEIFRENADIIGGIPYPILLQNDDVFREMFPELHSFSSQKFSDYKAERNLFEYDELIRILIECIKNAEDSFIEFKKAYNLIIVDEFQDTDPMQLEFLKYMKSKSIVVVGDDWQAIYSFRGATVEPFLGFKKKFKKTKKYYLAENYRSLPAIVNLGGRVIRHSKKQIRKKVKSVREKKSGNSVCGMSLSQGQEKKIINHVVESKAVILVRSNFRRKVWMNSGCADESVMTIHKAKGLEFENVFLDLMGGWNHYDPALESIRNGANDEEIRILYVALTRAMNCLTVLYDSNAPADRGHGALWNDILYPEISARMRNIQRCT